jgi:predicted Zn-ribbon and HTH transcriptional regulator
MEENIEIQFWECTKCGHRWTNRKPAKPTICPKCHNYLWVRQVEPKTEPVKE